MATGISAINRLSLDKVFVGKLVHRSFEKCWTVRCDDRLLIVDDNKLKCSRFADEDDYADKSLLVINTKKREIVLLAIDQQLLTGIKGGIADCALFDVRQFRFVEFKTNAEGNAKKNFDKATSQLKNTIRLFANKLIAEGIHLEKAVELSCHIVVSHTFPRSTAMMQNYQLEFATDTGGVLLSFDSETTWE